MELSKLDWAIIVFTLATAIAVAVHAGKIAGSSTLEFFLSGRSMPWWLLGFSMVATTFSTDTPNLVADLTRTQGVAGNWSWWAFLLTGMVTTFLFAHLWRRSGVITDIEFYEIRYSGAAAAVLRGFRAVYLGVLMNVIIMAAVTLAAIKFSAVVFGFSPLNTVLIAGTVTAIYAAIGGLRGVILTDFFLFGFAMSGAVVLAYVSVNHPSVGGLDALFAHPNVIGKTAFLPDFREPAEYVPLFVIPLFIQWWSVWYPGSEPGGGGYVAQRMLAARDERNAVGAILFFNLAHYAVRPWPWILVALASLVIYPDIASLAAAFPNVDASVIGHDFAYPAMLTLLPAGWLGVTVASLIAAYLSTISTSLNLGSAYVVNDVYCRFLRKDAGEAERVLAGRIATVAIMLMAGALSLALSNALQAFTILLSVGAGTGLLFMLRWYWPRINAWSEITAMVVSFIVSLALQFHPGAAGLPNWLALVIGVGITTLAWVAVTLITPATDRSVLTEFCRRIQPAGIGWREYWNTAAPAPKFRAPFAGVFLGCAVVYGVLFSAGSFLQGDLLAGAAFAAAAALASYGLRRVWRQLDIAAR